MKWDYDVNKLRELVAAGQPVQGDVVEALRGIAEQLERIGDKPASEKWKHCRTHGDIDGSKEWGCPECIREMREELARKAASLT